MISKITDLVKMTKSKKGTDGNESSKPGEIKQRPIQNDETSSKPVTIDRNISNNKGTGEVITPEEGRAIAEREGIETEKIKTIDDWKKRISESLPPATVLQPRSKSAGEAGVSAIYQRFLELTEPIVDWRAELAHYVGRLADKQILRLSNRKSSDKSSFRPSYKESENMLKNGVVALDVSGSVAASFPEFSAEVVGICAARKTKTISVLPFASDVHDEFQVKNGAKPEPEDFANVKTGGGSEAINLVIEWIEDNIGQNPDFVVIVTDGRLTHGLPEAPYWGRNTIWLVFDNPGFEAPEDWGTIIHAIGDPGYWKQV